MSMRGFLHFRDALELALLLLAGGVVQSELDNLGYALDVGFAGVASRTTQHGSGGDLRLFPAIPALAQTL